MSPLNDTSADFPITKTEITVRTWNQVMGVKGNLATTRPSKIELNIERRDVKAKPMANMDFILTIILK